MIEKLILQSMYSEWLYGSLRKHRTNKSSLIAMDVQDDPADFFSLWATICGTGHVIADY